jgi:hypothetical protein
MISSDLVFLVTFICGINIIQQVVIRQNLIVDFLLLVTSISDIVTNK